MEYKLEQVHNASFEDEIYRLTEKDIEALCRRKDEFIELACPVCSDEKGQLNYTIIDLEYRKCQRCETIFLSPCPKNETILWYLENSKALAFWRDSMPEATVRSRKATIYKERHEYVLTKANKFETKLKSVLDVGGGNGEFAESLAIDESIDRIVLVEPQPLSLNNNKIDVYQSSFEDFQTNERYSIITLFEVIEHIVNPSKLLKKIHQLLANDGIFILSTPNFGGFETSVLQKTSRAAWFDHVVIYNVESIRKLLEKFGFEVLEIETPGKFDFSIVKEAYLKDQSRFKDDYALRFLMDNDKKYGEEFQNYLQNNKLSSHMRCIARKVAGSDS